MLRHCKKLKRPKIEPMIRPPTGPSAIAAIAIGMILSVIESGPIGMVPRGVNENTISIAVKSARIVKARMFILFAFFIFSSYCRSNSMRRIN